MKPIALIFGASGQTGSYLCEKALLEGYSVVGMKRKSSSINTDRINHIFDNSDFKLEYGDVTDYASVSNLVSKVKPDIFINCAAQAHVRVSFDLPIYTVQATGVSVFNCLESIRLYSPSTKFITMSSSEMFGKSPAPQSLEAGTPFLPQSPYGIAKLMGYHAVINYREAYNLHVSNCLAFNHESPRRQEVYLTRKVTRAAARIKLGLQNKLMLGNLNSFRDWSHASDIADGVLKIVSADKPGDYTIASGEMHSVKEFVDIIFKKLNLDPNKYIEIDSRLFRPTEVDELCGNSDKIRKELGWQPQYTFEQLVDEMIAYDMELAKREKILMEHK